MNGQSQPGTFYIGITHEVKSILKNKSLVLHQREDYIQDDSITTIHNNPKYHVALKLVA